MLKLYMSSPGETTSKILFYLFILLYTKGCYCIYNTSGKIYWTNTWLPSEERLGRLVQYFLKMRTRNDYIRHIYDPDTSTTWRGVSSCVRIQN